MKLYVDKNLNINEKKLNYLSEFCAFCAQELPIEGSFNVYVVTDRPRHGIATTALYEVGNNTCRVYGKGRALPDVMRSIAHEMTHMMQDQQGLITGHVQDAGGFHEDQANARAGELLKRYAKSSEDRRAIYEGARSKKNIL
jgi:hypothetical protein